MEGEEERVEGDRLGEGDRVGEGDQVWEGDRVGEVGGKVDGEKEVVDDHHKLFTALHPVNTIDEKDRLP